MGDILPMRLKPIIRVERFGGLWGVSVRPCPDGIDSLRSFDCEQAAAEYAAALSARHGWRIRPDRHNSPPRPAPPPEAA